MDNLLKLPNDKLKLLLEYLKQGEVLANSKCEETYIDGVITRKHWNWYSYVWVYDDRIEVSSGQGTNVVFTLDDYNLLKKAFS